MLAGQCCSPRDAQAPMHRRARDVSDPSGPHPCTMQGTWLILHTHTPTPSRQCNTCEVSQAPPANLHDPVAYSLLPACKLLPHTVLAEQWDGNELPEEGMLSLPLGQRCEARLQSRAVRKAWRRRAGLLSCRIKAHSAYTDAAMKNRLHSMAVSSPPCMPGSVKLGEANAGLMPGARPARASQC